MDANQEKTVIKRRYFYSATRRDTGGTYAWWHGTLETTSWRPMPARKILSLAVTEAKEGIECISGAQEWHDSKPRIVALNQL